MFRRQLGEPWRCQHDPMYFTMSSFLTPEVVTLIISHSHSLPFCMNNKKSSPNAKHLDSQTSDRTSVAKQATTESNEDLDNYQPTNPTATPP